MKELRYFFKIIFYILIALSIFYIVSLFIYPKPHFENNRQKEKLHISASKIEADKAGWNRENTKNITKVINKDTKSYEDRKEHFDLIKKILKP
jgi:hypothetical protein